MQKLIIQLKNIEVRFAAKDILTIPSLAVYENEKIGIIGDNGSGKSILLKLIAKELEPAGGKVESQIDFPFFRQIADVNEQNSPDLEGELLSRFNIPSNKVETLSGGEQTKYRLTQILSDYQPGMLLDEPTTHLDQKACRQLIDELKYYYGTLLFVSHDRSFLNALADKIWEVKEGSVIEYKGNYEAYRQQKKNEKIRHHHDFENYQKEVNRLKKGIESKREQAAQTARVSTKNKKKNIRPDRLSSSRQKDTVQKNLQKKAKAMVSRLDQLKEVQAIKEEQKIVFPAHKTVEIHNPYPIRAENVSITFGNKLILDQLNFQVPLGKKIALIGENGAGKSTLLRAIRMQKPGIILSPKAVIATYDQMDYQLQSFRPLVDQLMSETDWPESTVRTLLNKLGFSQLEINKPLNVLSGGEATRIAIASLFVRPSNILLLDEPTNFIDLATIEALEIFLKAYQGTVLFTSHDRYFVEQVADEEWKLAAGKLIQ